MIKLRPYQEEVKSKIFKAWNDGYKNILLQMSTGSGKCLGKNTPVLMYDGSIKMVQDIVEGDRIMGPDSSCRSVLSICRGKSPLYKISPVKGDPWVCNDVHILSLKHTGCENIIDIEIQDYLKKGNDFKHRYKQFRVGVNFKKQEVPFDAYLMGTYLAEGCHCNNNITTPEIETLFYLKDWADKNDMKLNISQGKNCFEISFADNKQGWHKNKIKKLREYCTSRTNRWIPKEYLLNDEETRLNLLAGILDGDGYLHENGFEIVTKYKQLSDDILYLCRSLGLAAYCSLTTKTIKSINFSGIYYRIYISGDTDKIPNRIPRKKAGKRKQIKDVLKTGFSIENIGMGEYYGFELDNDGRFLLGDFTVTHNTRCFCSLIIDTLHDPKVNLPTAIMVHRKELVQQICLVLAEEEIPHNIIASRQDIKSIIAAERRMFKKQFYNPHSDVTVISVDTLISRQNNYKNWCKQIKQWITDEAAHVLKENKWGKAISFFENARGLGVTATPERLDRKGLGSHVDGVFDVMIEGPPTRWFIDNGYLSKYKIAIPESDYNNYLTNNSETSDYSKQAMTDASNKSHIVGDVVENYLKFAKGKQAILFASDVNTAKRMAQEFKNKGVSAIALDATTPDAQRLDTLIKFREKTINLLINVDLFDEGLDVPGIECVILARPTKSLGKFLQMIGRGLRPLEGKDFLIVIDHVGNILRHGLPCNIRHWTLDRIKKSSKKLNFLRICSNIECNAPYDRVLTQCPWCATEAIIIRKNGDNSGRIPPQMVDGDLFLIDPETLRDLQNKSILEDPGHMAERVTHAVNMLAGLKAMKTQKERIETQKLLAEEIALWAGKLKKFYRYNDRMIHKKFYLIHNQTITEALGQPKAIMLEMIEDLKGM